MVYLLHLSRPMKHAQHYIGWAQNFEGRMAHHRGGSGARFTQVAVERGIDLIVARTWDQGDRSFERRLKNWHKSSDFCPICNPDTAMKRMIL